MVQYTNFHRSDQSTFWRTASELSMRLLILPIGLVWLTLASPARGDEFQSKAAAELLFSEAKQLLDRGETNAACAKFEASMAADAAPGTLLNLAICYERAGRFATAWATYRSAATLSTRRLQTERADFARAQADRLESTLPKLRIVVPAEHRLATLSISVGGKPLPALLWDTAVPMDPAQYSISASAPGHDDWSTIAEVTSGQESVVVIPLLSATGRPSAAPTAPSSTPPRTDASRRSEARGMRRRGEATKHGSTRRSALAYVLGAAGLTSFTIAGALGGLAFAYDKRSEAHCDNSNRCDRTGTDRRNTALLLGNLATAATIAGVGSGVGAYIAYTSSRGSGPSGSAVLAGWSLRF